MDLKLSFYLLISFFNDLLFTLLSCHNFKQLILKSLSLKHSFSILWLILLISLNHFY